MNANQQPSAASKKTKRNRAKRLRKKQKNKAQKARNNKAIVPTAPKATENIRITGGIRNPRRQKLLSTVESRNKFIQGIVDPEHSDCLGIPDSYPHPTAICKPLIDMNLEPLTTTYDSTVLGTYLVWVMPQLSSPVWVLGETINSGAVSLQRCHINWTTATPFGGAILGATDDSELDTQFITTDWKNLVGHVEYQEYGDDSTYQFLSPQNAYTSTTGPFFGIPGLGTNYANVAYHGALHLTFLQIVPSTVSFECRIVDRNGILQTTPAVGTGNSGEVHFDNIFQGVAGDIGFPGIGVQVRVDTLETNGINKFTLLGFNIEGWVGVDGSEGRNTILMRPIPYPDKGELISLLSEYRYVGQSTTVTFVGPAITMAGKSCALSYQGGNTPGQESFYSYDLISNKREAYAGPLNMGSYSYYRPDDTTKLKFRKPRETHDPDWPYVVSAGVVSYTNGYQPNSLKLRVCGLIEFVSDSQLFGYHNTPNSPREVEQAMELIHMIQSSMENPLHLERIKEFFKKIGGVAVKAGQFVYDNRELLLPIVKNLAMAAGMVL